MLTKHPPVNVSGLSYGFQTCKIKPSALAEPCFMVVSQVAADEHKDVHAALFHFLLLIETQGLDLRKLVNTAKGAAVLERILGLASCDLCYNPFRFATWDALARKSPRS